MQELKEYLKVREDLYRTLGKALYLEPDCRWLDALRKRIPVFEALAKSQNSELLREGIESLSCFLKECEGRQSEATEELACIYARLFLGVASSMGEPTAALCESVYLSNKKMMMQDERDNVVKFYAKFGMATDSEFTEPEDHISAELGFLASMSAATLEDIENNDEDATFEKLKGQREFLETHLLKWADKLSAEISRYATDAYYPSIGKIVAGYVQSDYIFISCLTTEEAVSDTES